MVARGGHFEFENQPGVPQRFYGVNICEDANVPPLGSADRFAANLARAGYNAIRFHHHETDLVAGTGDPSATTLNPERMERFDALVAACIEHGIYLTTDLFVSRRGISWRSVGGPGRFRGLGGIATGAEAALQDWSGLWRFAWAHGVTGVTHPEQKGLGPFDVANDPLQRASDLACVFLFLRGDLAPLKDEFVVGFPRSSLAVPDPSLNESAAASPELTRAGWAVRLGMGIEDGTSSIPIGGDVFAKRPESVDIDEATGRFLFSTPRMAGGFAENGRIDAGPLSFKIVECQKSNVGSLSAANDSSLVTRHSSLRSAVAAATVWAASLDGKALERSSRILVAHITDVQPKGSRYADEDMNILLSWGEQRRMVMRRGRAEVSLRLVPGSYAVHSLNADGTRRGTVPFHMEGGRLRFTAQVDADPSSATWLYEIVNSGKR